MSEYYKKIYTTFNKLKVRIYLQSLYFKQISEMYTIYKEKITHVIQNHPYLKYILYQSIPVYKISQNNNRITRINIRNRLPPDVIIMPEKIFHQMSAIKIILQSFLDYDRLIQIYLIKLQKHLNNIIETQKIASKAYHYLLNLTYTNGKGSDENYKRCLTEVLEHQLLLSLPKENDYRKKNYIYI